MFSTEVRVAGARVQYRDQALLANGRSVPVRAKTASVFDRLAARPDEAISRRDLLDHAWPRQSVGDHVLTQSIRELRDAFAALGVERSAIETVPKLGYRLRSRPTVNRSPLGPILVPALGMVLLALGAAGWAWIGGRESALPSAATDFRNAFFVAQSVPVTSVKGEEQFPSIAPDGSLVAYGGKDRAAAPSDLYIRGLEASDSLRLTHTPQEEWAPAIGPDSRRVAFFRYFDDRCALVVMPVHGGAEKEIAPCERRYVNYMDWTPDGSGLVYSHFPEAADASAARLRVVDSGTGNTVPLSYATEPGLHDWMPRYSPDGRWLAFLRGRFPHQKLMVMPAGGGRPVTVPTDVKLRTGYDWMPGEMAVIARAPREAGNALDIIAIPDGHLLRRISLPMEAAYPSVAQATGEIVFSSYQVESDLFRVDLDDSTAPESLHSSTHADRQPAYAPDGSRFLFVSRRSGTSNLWIAEPGGDAAQITHLASGGIINPTWSQDGSRVLYIHATESTQRLMLHSLGTGKSRALTGNDETVLSATFSADDRHVYFDSDRDGTRHIWRMKLASGETSRILDIPARYPRTFAGDPHVYFQRDDQPGIWRVAPGSGQVERFSDLPVFPMPSSWTLVNEGLVYLGHTENERLGLFRADPADAGQPTLLREFQRYTADLGFSLAPERRHVLISLNEGRDSDIHRIAGTARPTRGAAPASLPRSADNRSPAN